MSMQSCPVGYTGPKLRRDVWAGNKYGSDQPTNSKWSLGEDNISKNAHVTDKRPQWKLRLHPYVEIPKYEDRNAVEKKIQIQVLKS